MNYPLQYLIIMFNEDKKGIDHDWMGFKVNENNPITGHHIKKISEGGENIVTNIAILTSLGHKYLHDYIELYSPDTYAQINEKFVKINGSRIYPTLDDCKIIVDIMNEFENNYKPELSEHLRFASFNEKILKRLPQNINVRTPEGYRKVLQMGIDPVDRPIQFNKRKRKKY